MTVRVAANSNNRYQQKEMRTLIVNNAERFRLIVGNKLRYAKGKINFNLNWPILGDGKTHPIYVLDSRFPDYYYSYDEYDGRIYTGNCIPKSLYAFYEDGFYLKKKQNSSTDEYFLYQKQNLLDLVKECPAWAKSFKGWFTAKEGGKKINTIKDINNSTDLFKYKKETSLPEITLYAQWELKKYTLNVCNIKFYCKENPAKSSWTQFEYNGKVYNGKTAIEGAYEEKIPLIVDAYTDIVSYLKKNIKNPKYVTWAKNTLNNTKSQTKLQKGPQKFLGWFISSRSDEFRANDNQGMYEEIPSSFIIYPPHDPLTYYIYPCFEVLVIIPQTKSPKTGKLMKERFYTFNLEDEKDPSGVWIVPTFPSGAAFVNHPLEACNVPFWHGYTTYKKKDGYKVYDSSYYWTYYRTEGYYRNSERNGYFHSSTIILKMVKVKA